MIVTSNPYARPTTSGATRERLARYAPMAAQIALAAVFVLAGVSKLVMPADELTANSSLSAGFLRFIGWCELFGAAGLVLPSLMRLPRMLTPLAAGGLVVIMVGAVVVTLLEGMYAAALWPLAVGMLLGWVMYVRWPPPGRRRERRPAHLG